LGGVAGGAFDFGAAASKASAAINPTASCLVMVGGYVSRDCRPPVETSASGRDRAVPEVGRDTQRVHLMNQYSDVVAQDLEQHFVLLGDRRLAPHGIAEHAFDREERPLDVAALVVVRQVRAFPRQSRCASTRSGCFGEPIPLAFLTSAGG